jgi:hypothetical protein
VNVSATVNLRADSIDRTLTTTPAEPTDRPALKLAVHGAVVEIDNVLPSLRDQIARLLVPFAVQGWPDGFVPVHGTVRPYDEVDVLRHLSPAARALPRSVDLTDFYQDRERFWVVDERWGMAELNFLKGHWRSWVLPRPQFDPVRCAEMAVIWPLAQLLRPRGLYLLPAAAAVRDNFAVLILCPFGIEPELTALARSGYRLISQRWTALREEDGRIAMLHMPGAVRKSPRPQPRRSSGEGTRHEAGPLWVDLKTAWPHAWQNHAFCDAVLIADPGRRAHTTLKELDPTSAAALLRRAWPITELHPARRHSPIPAKLAQFCRCAELQLSRDPQELIPLLDSFQQTHAAVANGMTAVA